MDAQQELFIALRNSIAQEYSVYDGYMPPEDTPYPFVYLADSQMIDSPNKTKINGRVFQTIHVWHNSPMKRGTVSAMMLNIKNIARSIKATTNFHWMVRSVDQRILADNTTKKPLLHGVVEIEFYFS